MSLRKRPAPAGARQPKPPLSSKSASSKVSRAKASASMTPKERDDGYALPDWRKLMGHDEVLAGWQRLVAEQALPQVLLLEGREGIGKRGLMAYLVALHGCASQTACGTCDGCRWVLSGRHPDVFWWESETGKLLIEEAGLLQEHLDLSPDASGRRFALIVDADQLSMQAANRLLKTLEEPPPGAVIVLSTSRLGGMLKTILSRCVVWHVKPPLAAASLEFLRQRMDEAGRHEISDEALRIALKRCGRSPGKALAYALSLSAEGGAAPLGLLTQDLLSAAEVTTVLRIADELTRQSGLSLAELLHEWEIELNRVYRRALSGDGSGKNHADPRLVAERRRILREAKALVLRAKTPLNAQLTAESLGLKAY